MQGSARCLLTHLYFFSAQRGTTSSEAPDKTNNQPHIICFQDEKDLFGQYFIAVEQMLRMESQVWWLHCFLCSVHIIFLMYSTTPKPVKWWTSFKKRSWHYQPQSARSQHQLCHTLVESLDTWTCRSLTNYSVNDVLKLKHWFSILWCVSCNCMRHYNGFLHVEIACAGW